MNELDMTISTKLDGKHEVSLTAGFATQETAVQFFDRLAALCRSSTGEVVNIPLMARVQKMIERKP